MSGNLIKIYNQRRKGEGIASNLLSRVKNHSDKANKRDSILQNLILPVHPFTSFLLPPLPITLVLLRCRNMGLPKQIRAEHFLAAVRCSFKGGNGRRTVGCKVENRMRRVEGDGVCVEVMNLQWR